MNEQEQKLTHGTKDELRYLHNIGEEGLSKLPRSQRLQNYIDAAQLRVHWGNLDKDLLLAEAAKMRIDALLEEKKRGR
jgi:hypothetical protein